MQIALISDIHGNLIALDAVLENIRRQSVDSIIFLGDIATGGPHPTEVIETIQRLGCPCILGNHDEALLDPASAARLQIADPIIPTLHWCIQQLSPTHFDHVRTFQHTLDVSLGGGASLFCFHGSPQSNYELLLATTPVEVLSEMFGDRRAKIFAGGHTHVQMLRQHNSMLILNPGSVGQPFRSVAIRGAPPALLPWAEYALVDWADGALSVDLRRVPFDLQEYMREIEKCNVPLKDWLLTQYRNAVL